MLLYFQVDLCRSCFGRHLLHVIFFLQLYFQVDLCRYCLGRHVLHVCFLFYYISRWIYFIGLVLAVVMYYICFLCCYISRWIYVGLVLAVVYYMCFFVLTEVRQVRSVVGMFLFIMIPYCLGRYPDKVCVPTMDCHVKDNITNCLLKKLLLFVIRVICYMSVF